MALHSHKQGEFSDNLVEKQRNGYSGSEFLDSRWSEVGAHMGDHELEEGEACDEPDVICDPDTDFAYLDEKIFMVLGDVQKYFEGGVSAEKLGSKFGGYGSFLPPQERTMSILHQDKPASVVASDAYCRTKKSSNEGLVERIKRTATGSSVRASSSKAVSSSAVLMHENGGRDFRPVNEKASNIESSFPVGRVEENTGLPKNFKIKIKMGSENNEKRKNATIYSDFGLSNSSSEGEEEFVDEDRRSDSDPDSSPDRTPLTIIRIMTSHHIPDGMLLSPLPDLVTEPFIQKERLWSICQEDLNERVRSPALKKVRQIKEDGETFEKVEVPREKTREHAVGKGPLDVSSEPSDGKKRSSMKGCVVPTEGKANSSQDGRHSTSKGSGAGKLTFPAIDIPAREVPESKKRPIDFGQEAEVSRASLRERGKDSVKEVQRKDKQLKTSSAVDLVVDETPKDGPQHSLKTVGHKDYKGSQQVDLPKVHKTESVEHKRKEKLKERVTSDHGNKEPSKVFEDRQRDLATRDVSIKAPQPASISEAVGADKQTQQPQLGALPPPPSANGVFVVVDNWVGCDKCQKWRLLPPGVDEANLPKKWRCKMLNWLEEGMNNCTIPEAETTERTRALYNTVAEQPAPMLPPAQENPPVVEQVPPPVPVLPALPPPLSIHVTQEPKAPEKIRPAVNKKRKIPPTASSDNVVPTGKNKSSVDAPRVTQDGSQAKLGGGSTITTQERISAKVGGTDLGIVKTGEEKQKMKEREKARRHRPVDGASPAGKKHSQTPANIALREAIKLKHKANDLKGQEPAGTALYLQAALKFLQAASMLESESSEHGDNRLPAQIYGDTAKLCQYCASTYERSKDLAAAALAYKCTGVARMRVVQAKNSLISKDRAEVQSAHQVAPGESPSSSTPLNVNSAMERIPTQGAASPASNPHTGGSLIIAARSRTSFDRVLQFVAETNTAIDALSKAVSVFSAAESAAICSQEGMSALRKVLDFGFHDVDCFVRLVRIALEAMGH